MQCSGRCLIGRGANCSIAFRASRAPPRDEFYIADEAFLTGTAAEVTPIRELDDRTIGLGKPGDITKRVQHIFFETVKGKNKKYKKWLTYLSA